MFNMKNFTKSAQSPYEKYHRDNTLGPKADDKAPIWEKTLTHRDGFEQTITENQMKSEQENTEDKDAQVLEKVLESANSDYVRHRSDAGDLSMPPINALVEKMRRNRISDRQKDEINPAHWTLSFDDDKQLGALPKWPKMAPQHTKPVLGNDPNRFTGTNEDPTEFHKDEIKPLIGAITTADVDNVAIAIKNGRTAEYDAAVLAILRLAQEERRELSDIERKTVSNLKIARTQSVLNK